MSRFVSAAGPDEESGVRFASSARSFEEAKRKSDAIRSRPGAANLTTVIYRLSYDPNKDEFHSWRQTEEKSSGTEKDPDDNTKVALAYEIFTVPEQLLRSDAGQRVINAQIDLIATHSQMDRPGKAGPPK